jgi:hypothetical protein
MFSSKAIKFLSLIFWSQKVGVRYLSGVVKDQSFLSKLVVTVDPYALSFEHKDPKAEKIFSTIFSNPKKVDKFLNVSKVSCQYTVKNVASSNERKLCLYSTAN